MCTAATYKTKDFYFGRTLDYEFSYGEKIVITPRNYRFDFEYMGEAKEHLAIIGMAHVSDNYPLYYDGINEAGLGMAGLNFVGNAKYGEDLDDKKNVAQYEFIPWILCQCHSVKAAKELLLDSNITARPFKDFPCASLHWIIADKEEAITVECMEDGMHIYENEVGVLTNNPSFDKQMFNLNNYRHLSVKDPEDTFSENISLTRYSRGMGAIGLPGDLSSASRFVRVAFAKLNAVSDDSEQSSVSQFFHILGSVWQNRGLCEVAPGKFEITIYASCCNADKGIYYYKTYDNHQITAVDMNKENLDQDRLIEYPMINEGSFNFQN